jgi:hypothetical protein
MDRAEIPLLPVADKPALSQAVVRLAFSRPPILDATRAVGLTDAEVACLLGCTPMQVSHWATGRRPIPKIKLFGLYLFIERLKILFVGSPAGPYAKRARILGDALSNLAAMSFEEAWPGESPIPDAVANAGIALQEQMLVRLEASITASVAA